VSFSEGTAPPVAALEIVDYVAIVNDHRQWRRLKRAPRRA
jgi:hypothetical protein